MTGKIPSLQEFRMTRYREINRRKFLGEAGKYTTGLTAFGYALPEMEVTAPAQSSTEAPSSGALISKLSRFVAGVRYDAIPPKALDTAKTAIMDCLGVAVAGGSEESTRIAGRMAREDGGKETATLFGQRFKLPTVQAALVNGIASHAHDFDHSFVIGGQPTSPIIPAVFTMGESLGASGKQLLEAYVAGFELVGAMMLVLENAGGAG